MEPKLKNGEHVIAINLPFVLKRLRKNDIVVFKKYGQYFVKKISQKTNQGYVVLGENKSDSLDSRKFGPISFKDICGKVVYKY